MRPIFLLAIGLFWAHSLCATTRKVLFIGNSYTYTNSMPDMFRDFATAKGDTLVYASSAPGGWTFQQHIVYAPTLSGIASQPWDVVVLQEQSQRPSFPPAQVATDVYPYARLLDSVIDEQDTCIETMFMMTWGRKTGDAMNCPGYPVVCTYAGMQGRLRDSYMEMAVNNHASVAPVGAAWKIVVDSFPSIDLYSPDESHQSVAGSYLQACVFYASVFHKPAMGCTYLGTLSASVAATLQRIADKVVLDSLSQWQQHGHYTYSGFKMTYTGPNTVAFTNTSQRADSYLWSFGDGTTSTLANPTHTYVPSGNFAVKLAARNGCIEETRIDTARIAFTGSASQLSLQQLSLRVQQKGGGQVQFVSETGDCYRMQVLTMDGRVHSTLRPEHGQAAAVLPAGMYVLRAFYADGEASQVVRFSVY